MPALYANNIKDFLEDDLDSIIGKLSMGVTSLGFYQLKSAAAEAWKAEIEILKGLFSKFKNSKSLLDQYILLEYSIPRRGKRADAVLLWDGLIIVIEFKVGAKDYHIEAKRQVEDYALDLRDFHKESIGRPIIPLLVATEAQHPIIRQTTVVNDVSNVYCTGISHFDYCLKEIGKQYLKYNNVKINLENWNFSEYFPTPTIIEAATTLFAKHNVLEIARTQSGAKNLSATTDAVYQIVNKAKAERKKVICFITGVPGAGKTLAGLNIAHKNDLNSNAFGTFLSGNGPLVKVLREALARDSAKRNEIPINQTRRQVSTFIENVHHFLSEYYSNNKIPNNHVVIFDEAQRAWDKEQSFKKFKRGQSESEMMLQIMDRHNDWAAIIALIGGGQEINSGEAGLSEWGRAISAGFQDWEIFISHELVKGSYSTAGNPLFENIPDGINISEVDELHLQIPIRSYKADKLAEFVERVLLIDSIKARSIKDNFLKEYPLAITRNLGTAKIWLKSKQRGFRRTGLVASSGERRIKPYGLSVTNELDAVSWFLNSEEDVRSSCFLEDPATEFSIQGLELDWCGLCWGADFRMINADWQLWQFKGTKWQSVNSKSKRQFIINKYRVLLTRSREGLIVWVPSGDDMDSTRQKSFYDSTYNYLVKCGFKDID
jgi:DUF2075 family protein